MKGSPDRIGVCTTTYFDGIIAAIDPETSWVSRWQRTCTALNSSYGFAIPDEVSIAKYVRGMYAVRVKGRIPEDVEAELYSRGIKYRPRDQTDQD
jgi:transcription elongation factor SPT4